MDASDEVDEIHVGCGGRLHFEFAYETYIPIGDEGLDGYDETHMRVSCDRCGASGYDDDLD